MPATLKKRFATPLSAAATVAVTTTATTLLGTVAPTALAAGFYLAEVGSPGSLGTAGVANVTNNKGADAAWTNPAGLTGVAPGHHIASGLQVAVPQVNVTTS